MLKIWGRTTSANVQKVLWMADEIGLAYERIDVGGRFRGLDTPAYRALNPNARVPTIEDDGVVAWESNAILRYLAARYSEGVLWDKDPGVRAQVDQWMDWMQTTLAPDYYGLFWAAVRSPPERRNPAAIREHARLLAERYRLLDRLLAGRTFLLGERLSMADIAIGVTLYRYHEMEVERPALANFAAWYARLGQRPAYRRHVMTSFEELRGRSQS